MDRHDYCRGSLKDAREAAREAGVKIPTTSSAWMHDDHYAVFLGDDYYEEFGACCAFYARCEAIHEFIKLKLEAE
jgi:hypothetical protein